MVDHAIIAAGQALALRHLARTPGATIDAVDVAIAETGRDVVFYFKCVGGDWEGRTMALPYYMNEADFNAEQWTWAFAQSLASGPAVLH